MGKEGITCHLHCNVCNGTNMKIGDKVESHWRASGCGSKSSGSPDPATVAKVNDDGTLNIKWDDDCYQEDIPCDWVTKVSRDGCVDKRTNPFDLMPNAVDLRTNTIDVRPHPGPADVSLKITNSRHLRPF